MNGITKEWSKFHKNCMVNKYNKNFGDSPLPLKMKKGPISVIFVSTHLNHLAITARSIIPNLKKV